MQCCQLLQESVFLLQPQIPVAVWKLHCFGLKELPVPVGHPEKTKYDQHNIASLKAKYTDLKEYVDLKYYH